MGPKALNFIHSVARKSLTKGQGSGITKIPGRMEAEAKASEIASALVDAGLDFNKMDDFIKSEADVVKYLNILESAKRERMKPIPADSPRGREITEQLFGKRGEVVDMKGNVIPEGSGIMGGESIESLMKSGDVTKGTVTKKSKKASDRDMFRAANERFKKTDIDKIIKNINKLDPIEAMKEANKIIKRDSYYKGLSDKDAKRILTETEDHIFGRDVDMDPEDFFATGGRVGLKGGGADMGGVADSQGNVGSSFGGGNNDGPDDRSTAAQTAAHNAAVAAAQEANTVEEKMNILDTLNRFRPNTFVNPYNYSINLNKNIGPFGLNVGINTLGMLGIDDPRTPEDESELDDYGISGGFNTDILGGNLSLGGGYSPTTGTNFGLSYSKQFNQGGRVNFLKGGDTNYNAMVTEMYIKAGGQEGTGMDIDSFAAKYFPKMAQGGRIGYSNGSEDYGDLLDAYEKGIDVMPGESLTEYINRIREAEKRSKLND